MLTLVIGGASSGKSAYGESLIAWAGPGPRYYVATMEPCGAEGAARVAKHRAARAGGGFETIERYTDLSSLDLPDRGAVLLECLGNLAANELFAPGGAGDDEGAFRAVMDGVDHLCRQCTHLVAVSSEVCTGGRDYEGDTDRYLRLLARVHRALCARADNVCEVVCGCAQYYKGREPEW